MKQKHSPSTVLLLLNAEPKPEAATLKRWFRTSRFLTFETTDIYQALEDISDFTVENRPDIMLLEIASFVRDLPAIRKLMRPLSDIGKVKILVLNETCKTLDEADCFVGSLQQIKKELDKIIPGNLTPRTAH